MMMMKLKKSNRLSKTKYIEIYRSNIQRLTSFIVNLSQALVHSCLLNGCVSQVSERGRTMVSHVSVYASYTLSGHARPTPGKL